MTAVGRPAVVKITCFNSNVLCHCHFLRASIIRLIIAFLYLCIQVINPYKGVRPESRGGCHGGTSWGHPPQFLSLVAPPAGPVERLSDGARKSTQPCVSAVPRAWVIMARARAVITSWPRPPTPKSYEYSSPFGLEVRGHWWLVGEIQSVWCTSDWQPRNRLQTSDSAPGRRSPLGSVEIPRWSLQ